MLRVPWQAVEPARASLVLLQTEAALESPALAPSLRGHYGAAVVALRSTAAAARGLGADDHLVSCRAPPAPALAVCSARARQCTQPDCSTQCRHPEVGWVLPAVPCQGVRHQHTTGHKTGKNGDSLAPRYGWTGAYTRHATCGRSQCSGYFLILESACMGILCHTGVPST
jgi:hypothetical protein